MRERIANYEETLHNLQRALQEDTFKRDHNWTNVAGSIRACIARNEKIEKEYTR